MNNFFQIVSLQQLFGQMHHGVDNLFTKTISKNQTLENINNIIDNVNYQIHGFLINNFHQYELMLENSYKLKYIVLDNEDIFVVRCSSELEHLYNILGISPIHYLINKE